MKRVRNLWTKLIGDENLRLAIEEVNRTHHWHTHHTPNKCTEWVENHKDECVVRLREILTNGFVQAEPRRSRRWDVSAQKWREINEPRQWPDQYVHHALIQVLQPVMMRGMDRYCCGSIRGRGTHYGKEAIERWLKKDKKGTKYCLQCDIRHFYDSLSPEVVMQRMRKLVKDRMVLDLIWRIVKDGILIGAYTSQWFANTVLQPMDRTVRAHNGTNYYIRYMDNITVFGSNKRSMRKLKDRLAEWLRQNGMELKADWQVFPVGENIPGKAQRHQRGRLPSAVGYRYGRGYTVPRKRNLLRLKRQLSRFRKRREAGKPISVRMAAGLVSRFGQLKHCSNRNIYQRILSGEKIQRQLKRVIRTFAKRKEFVRWNTYLELRRTLKSSRRRAVRIPT